MGGLTTAGPDTVSATGIIRPVLLCLLGAGAENFNDFYQNFGVATGSTARGNTGWYREIPSNSNFCARYDSLQTEILTKGTDDGLFNPSSDGRIDVQSFNADGFTLVCDENWGVAAGQGLYKYLALDGFQAVLGSFNEVVGGTPPEILDVTGLPIGQPDGLILFGGRQTAAGPINNNLNSIGFVGTELDQCVLMNMTQAGVFPRNLGTYCRRGDAYANCALNAAGTVLEELMQVTAWLPTGFRTSWAKTSPVASAPINFVALKGCILHTGGFTLDGTLNSDTIVSGLPGPPKATWCISAQAATENASDTPTISNTATGRSRQMVCVFGDTVAKFQSYTTIETQAAGVPRAAVRPSSTVYQSGNDDGTTNGAWELQEITDDGFRFRCTNADSANRFVVFASLIEVGGYNAPHLGTD